MNNFKLYFQKLLSLLALLFFCYSGFAQDTIPKLAYDRFGNRYTIDQISIQPFTPAPPGLVTTATFPAGMFNVTFQDLENSTNVSFADPVLGQQRRDVVLQVCKDLSLLIDPAKDKCTNTKPAIEIHILADTLGGLTLGISSAYYVNRVGNSGFIGGEVWNTINQGKNSLANVPGGKAYHGFAMFSFKQGPFNTDLTRGPLPVEYDLYTIVVHEFFHILGFSNTMKANGTSFIAGSTFYSRYDKFIKYSGQNLIVSNNPAFTTEYDLQFNPSLNPFAATQGGCNVSESGPFYALGYIPVFAPATFNSGSLGHLDTVCGPVHNYLMARSLNRGNRRIPTVDEINILEEIGYKITGQFGDGSLSFHKIFPANGVRIAGVSDFKDCNGAPKYVVSACKGSSITISDILSNDEGAQSFEGLQILSGKGTLSAITSNSFVYSPDSTFLGTVTLRYVPVSSNGEKGNATTIYVVVTQCGVNCTNISPCNKVCNPDFTTINKAAPYDSHTPFNAPSKVAGWICSYGTPDDTIPPGYGKDVAGMWAQYDGTPITTGEGLLSMVNLKKGKKYILSFTRRVSPYNCAVGPANQLDKIIVNFINKGNGYYPSNYTFQNSDPLPITSQVIYRETDIQAFDLGAFKQVIVCFTPVQDWDYLMIYPFQYKTKGAAYLEVDHVELIEDKVNAGPDLSLIDCKSQALLGDSTACTVNNTSFAWFYNTAASFPLGFGKTFLATKPGKYIIQRSISNSNALTSGFCLNTDTVLVTSSFVDSSKVTGPDVLCNGSSGTLTASLGAAFKWSTGATTQSITVSSGGTYTVTITSATGCTSAPSKTVLSSNSPTVDAGPNKTTICGVGIGMSIGGMPTAQGLDAPFTYNWTPAAGSPWRSPR